MFLFIYILYLYAINRWNEVLLLIESFHKLNNLIFINSDESLIKNTQLTVANDTGGHLSNNFKLAFEYKPKLYF